MTYTATAGTLQISMSLQDFADRLGLTTERTSIRPVRVDIDGDAVTIYGDAPEGSYGAVQPDGSLTFVVADRA